MYVWYVFIAIIEQSILSLSPKNKEPHVIRSVVHSVRHFATYLVFLPPPPPKIDPHPDFPTVTFPNPEEGKSALVGLLW